MYRLQARLSFHRQKVYIMSRGYFVNNSRVTDSNFSNVCYFQFKNFHV
jgi:hypothetical protein